MSSVYSRFKNILINSHDVEKDECVFMKACRGNDYEYVKENLKEFDVTKKNIEGYNSLFLSIKCKSSEVIEILIESGKFNLFERDFEGKHIIHHLIKCDMLKFIEKYGDLYHFVIDENVVRDLIKQNKLDIFKILFPNLDSFKKKQINCFNLFDSFTLEFAKHMLELGFDVNCKDEYNNSNVLFINNIDFNVVKLLIDNGIEVNHRENKLNYSPLMNAMINRNHQLVHYLSMKGAVLTEEDVEKMKHDVTVL